MFGTVDTWLVWKLTGGRVHATDISCIATTGLFDFYIRDWSDFVFYAMKLPKDILPRVLDTGDDFGKCDKSLFGSEIPINCVVGDQQVRVFVRVFVCA